MLTLSIDEQTGELVDTQTKKRWTIKRGLSTTGDIETGSLQRIPYMSSFDWAWLDFYPQSELYQ